VSDSNDEPAAKEPAREPELTIQVRTFTDRDGVLWHVTLETQTVGYDNATFPPAPTGTLHFRSPDVQAAMPTALPSGSLTTIRRTDLQALLDVARKAAP
jgi:hypothetical protein